jgi:hypothetical protein
MDPLERKNYERRQEKRWGNFAEQELSSLNATEDQKFTQLGH